MNLFYVGMASCAVGIALAQAIAPHPVWHDVAAALAVAAVGALIEWRRPPKPPSGKPGGGRSIEVIIDEMAADGQRRPGSASSRALREVYAARPKTPRL